MNFVKTCGSLVCLFAVIVTGAVPAYAVDLNQYATHVLDFSSEYSSDGWGAIQALGAPDTLNYGDISSAWAPGPDNGSLEYVTVGFSLPVYATGAVIRETCGNGFVYQVDVLDMSGGLHTVFTGADPSLPGSPVDFKINWNKTDYLVKGLKVYTDTNHDLSTWEEIDSISLQGQAAVPEPGSVAFLLAGVLAGSGLLVSRRRKRAVAHSANRSTSC